MNRTEKRREMEALIAQWRESGKTQKDFAENMTSDFQNLFIGLYPFGHEHIAGINQASDLWQ